MKYKLPTTWSTIAVLEPTILTNDMKCNHCGKVDRTNPLPSAKTNMTAGRLRIEITDAPLDDVEVEAVYITVSGVALDDEIYYLQKPKTIELSALTEGKTEVLLDQNVPALIYWEMSLILDYESDAYGTGPGCYILRRDGTKHSIGDRLTASDRVTIPSSHLEVSENRYTQAIIDFDLRKAIRYSNSPGVIDYRFRSDLSQALRLVSDKHFMLSGHLIDDLHFRGDKTIVYLYDRNSFSQDDAWMLPEDRRFDDAISSAVVQQNGAFQMHFLERGLYQIVVVNYYNTALGTMTSESVLEVCLTDRVDLNALNLQSDTYVEMMAIGASHARTPAINLHLN